MSEKLARLRSAVLGKTQFKKELVTHEGESFEVRQPSLKQRTAILEAAGIKGGDSSRADFGRMQVAAVIHCTHDPESGRQVFEWTDFDALLEQPTGGLVDKLSEVALKLMNVEPENAAKN